MLLGDPLHHQDSLLILPQGSLGELVFIELGRVVPSDLRDDLHALGGGPVTVPHGVDIFRVHCVFDVVLCDEVVSVVVLVKPESREHDTEHALLVHPERVHLSCGHGQ